MSKPYYYAVFPFLFLVSLGTAYVVGEIFINRVTTRVSAQVVRSLKEEKVPGPELDKVDEKIQPVPAAELDWERGWEKQRD